MRKVSAVTDTADVNGEFTEGNVAQGVPPTILKADIDLPPGLDTTVS